MAKLIAVQAETNHHNPAGIAWYAYCRILARPLPHIPLEGRPTAAVGPCPPGVREGGG